MRDINEMKPEEYMPLREVVFLTLRRRILRGELKPGERLMEISLANRPVYRERRSGKPFTSWRMRDWS